MRFTDQAGQAHTGTISQCDYGFYGPLGSSVTIVYLPNDPTTIAPTDGLITNALVNLIFTILFGLITLILLPFWIRKRIRKRSLHPEVDAGSYSTATRWREPMNEEPPQGVGGEDAVESGTAEIAPTMSQLLSGLRRVSERIDSMIADAARSREALHWAGLLQLLEDTRNNLRDIEYITRLARAARDLRGILLLHQVVMNTMAENNGILRSLLQDAMRWNDSELSQTMSQLLSGLRRVSERIDSMIADAARSREALHWAKIRHGVEDIMNHPRDIEYVVQLARAARDLRGILLLHQNVLDRAAESNHLLHSLISEASCSGQEPVRDNGYASD